MDFPDWQEAAVACASLLIGTVVLGTVGFGIGMTAAPFMLTVTDPVTVVVAVNAVGLLMYGAALYETRHHLPVREMTPIGLAGLLGVPIGVYFLASADAAILRVSITVAILALAVIVGLNLQRPVPKPNLVGPGLGFGVGVMVATLGIGGPLLVLFLLTRGKLRQSLRASMAFFFFPIEAASVIGFAAAGLFTAERVTLVIAAVPAVLVGFWISTILGRRMNERVFRRVAIGVIVATSLMLLVREIASL